jgi:hypothetical protein
MAVSLLTPPNKFTSTTTLDTPMEAVEIVAVDHVGALMVVAVMVVIPLLTLNQMTTALFMVPINGKCVISTLTAKITVLPQVAGLPILDAGEDTAVEVEATIIQTAKIKTFTMITMAAGIRTKIHNFIHKVAAAGLPEAGLPTIII